MEKLSTKKRKFYYEQNKKRIAELREAYYKRQANKGAK